MMARYRFYQTNENGYRFLHYLITRTFLYKLDFHLKTRVVTRIEKKQRNVGHENVVEHSSLGQNETDVDPFRLRPFTYHGRTSSNAWHGNGHAGHDGRNARHDGRNARRNARHDAATNGRLGR